MNERIEQLEFKVAFLEEANAQLGDTVYQQKLQIDALREQLNGFMSRVTAAQEQTTAYTAEQEKPPHY